jgi:hypothetical protein
MMTINGSCTNRSLWFAAIGLFAVILCGGLALAAPLPKITICHHANSSQVVTITVSENALAGHANHGDTLGACSSGGACACDLTFDPVTCTSNGKSYVNLCNAICDGASGCTRNSGSGNCACSDIFDPVRCSNGNVYASQCVATCSGATVCNEIGGAVCACDLTFNPVTCSDGNTYVNQCIATCSGAGGCGGGCPCSDIFDPVTCSSDGHTYINQCTADCAKASGCTPV